MKPTIMFTFIAMTLSSVAFSQVKLQKKFDNANDAKRPLVLHQPICTPEAMLLHGNKPENKKLDNPNLVYRICIDKNSSDNTNAKLAKHLVGSIAIINKSNCVFNTRVDFWWKGNHITSPAFDVFQTKEIPFDLTELKSNIDAEVQVFGANTIMVCDK